MNTSPLKTILIFSGSVRSGSINTQLANSAASCATQLGIKHTLINLADYPAPLYNGDDEAATGLPPGIRQFKKIILEHDALLIATPEYNGHLPPLINNMLNWASRAYGHKDKINVFANKYAGVMASSPGRLGGIRVAPRLRAYLSDLGVTVVPGFVCVPNAHQAYDQDGQLVDENTNQSLRQLLTRLAHA